jgi:predicted DCC family thiol-disulfide oxidoreductase YuxK
MYEVIYDGDCHLCVTFTRLLEQFDRGRLFTYLPMQAVERLKSRGITPEDCEMGMILIDGERDGRRWQGSDAAEEIVRLLPTGEMFVLAYRALPGAKWLGERAYEQIRDNRYPWFGKREGTYHSVYPFGCQKK